MLQRAKLDAEQQAREHEMKLKEAEFRRQDARDAEERKRQECAAARVKRYGDAIRNSINRQSNEPLEAVAFFRNAEALFATLAVPEDLQGVLIRPFLNEKSRALVARLDDTKAADFKEIKSLILRENKLTPASYREKFNTLRKEESETFVMFTSRLRTMLSSYIESRHVETFEDLQELFLCDRVKNTLGPETLKYILSIEAADESGWIKSKKLAESVDTYVANNASEKPRNGAASSGPQQQHNNGQNKNRNFQHAKAPGGSPSAAGGAGHATEEAQKGANGKKKGCFRCGSLSHYIANCPIAGSGNSASERGGNGQSRRVNNCTADTGSGSTVATASKAQSDAGGPSPSNSGRGSSANAGNHFASCKSAANDLIIEPCSDLTLCDIAKLHYIDVGVSGHVDAPYISVSAMEDSGSQIAVAQRSLIEKLDDVSVIGSVKIRGVIGDAVSCELVRLHVCLLSAGQSIAECAKRSVAITCAVSDDANESLLIPVDIVQRLAAINVVDVSRDSSDTDDSDDDDADNDNDDVNEHDDSDCNVHSSQDNEASTHVNVVTRSGRDTDSSTVRRPTNTVNRPTVCTPSAAAENVMNEPDTVHARDSVNADLASDIPVDSQLSSATRELLIKEQRDDPSLSVCWKLHEKGKGNFDVVNGLLVRRDKILGHEITQLVLPIGRRERVLEVGHGLQGAHMAWRNTSNRIRYNFWWPTIRTDVINWVSRCEVCQHKARVTCWDRVPIQPVQRADAPFSHWFMDVGGPLSSDKLPYNYFLVMCDSYSRFPVAFALRNVTSKAIADCLISVWQFVGCPSWVSCDNASYNVAGLTQELMRRLGCSPRFITPYHSEGNGSSERLVSSTKALIAKVAADHPKSWHKHLGFIMWALREVPNETTRVPPALLAFGRVPRGPLAILKETWCGEREFPPGLGKGPLEYLKELHESLEIAQHYAESHTQRAQQRYAERYNRRSRDKHFAVGDEVLILKPDSTASRVFSRWKGPAKIITVKSPYSYIVELDGVTHHLHANDLRRYNVKAEEISYDSAAFESDSSAVKLKPQEDGEICVSFCEALNFQPSLHVATCAIIHEEDEDFGQVQTVAAPTAADKFNAQNLPSQRIDADKLSHLNAEQRQQLLEVLDRYPDVFRDEPGLCTLVQHEIPLTADFRPRRLRAYRIPERLKPEVDRQIKELADQGFIRRSNSPMASPLVCVLKGPGGRDGVRLAVDYRFLNRYTVPDAFPVPDIPDVLQRIGNAKFISVFDATSGFWQTPIKPEDQWKSGFVCGDDLWEWTRTPFGMRSSGSTFCRAVQQVLKPIKDFTASYVDDMAVISELFSTHLVNLDRFLQTIRKAGMTLKLKKSRFAVPEVKFCGQLIGSGTRRADPEKVTAVYDLQVPETKRQVRQILGFFSFFSGKYSKLCSTRKAPH